MEHLYDILNYTYQHMKLANDQTKGHLQQTGQLYRLAQRQNVWIYRPTLTKGEITHALIPLGGRLYEEVMRINDVYMI
jgi:hypothetical protein